MLEIFLILIGGAVGTLLRFLVVNSFSFAFPWEILLVNTLGSFIVGFLYEFLLIFDFTIPGFAQKFIFFGVLGAFTTFSAYSLEVLQFFLSGRYKIGILYILGSNVFGLSAAIIGVFVTKFLKNTFY